MHIYMCMYITDIYDKWAKWRNKTLGRKKILLDFNYLHKNTTVTDMLLSISESFSYLQNEDKNFCLKEFLWE